MDDQVVNYAYRHAASGWLNLPQAGVLALRKKIVTHLQSKPIAKISQIAADLFKSFAIFNLDWQLVAQTEIGECYLQGYIAKQEPGTWVRRVETQQDSCNCCTDIHGLEYEVIAPDTPKQELANSSLGW